MMEKTTFWSRVGNWFRPSGRGPTGDEFGDGLGLGGNGGSRADVMNPGRFRLARATPAAERLEEEYHRIVRLVESVQAHLERQGDRTEIMANSLARLADSVSSLPETTRNQSETLGAIRQRMDTDGACLKRLDDHLSQLPRLADAQREALVTIRGQLDQSRQTSEKVSSTLDGFQQAVSLLGEATAASARAISDLRTETGLREQRLASLVQEQTRRLTIFAAAVMVLALGSGVVAVVLR